MCASAVGNDNYDPTFKLQKVPLANSNISHKHLSCASITEIQHDIMLAASVSITFSKSFQS